MTVIAINDAAVRRFRELWMAAALQLAHEASGDASWMGVPDAELAVGTASAWTLQLQFDHGPAGCLAVSWSDSAALAWARLGKPHSPAAELSDADRALLQQLLERLVRTAVERMRALGWGDCAISVVDSSPDSDATTHPMPLRFVNAAGEELDLPFQLDRDLCETLRGLPAANGESARIDMLRDVELEVSLRFGGRQVLLTEVLELSPGAVVELDRGIDGPVELLVGGKVIAWGEVVVVDGNYGLRITRLLQPMDRVAAMGGTR